MVKCSVLRPPQRVASCNDNSEKFKMNALTEKLYFKRHYLLCDYRLNAYLKKQKKFNQVEPNESTVACSSLLRPTPMHYGGYAGPWIENYFYNSWMGQRFSAKSKEMVYIPVFWSDLFFQSEYRISDYQNKIQSLLLPKLSPKKRYFTVCQSDDGLACDLGVQTKVYAAGGTGDIPIPLIKPVTLTSKKKRDITLSFMGELDGYSNPNGIRSEMYRIAQTVPRFVCGKFNTIKYQDILRRSYFSLCPRGNGKTSFRLYESLMLGSIPIYIWHDEPWLPFESETNWENLAVLIHSSEMHKIPKIIRDTRPSRIAEFQNAIVKFSNRYLSYRNLCDWIIKDVTNWK